MILVGTLVLLIVIIIVITQIGTSKQLPGSIQLEVFFDSLMFRLVQLLSWDTKVVQLVVSMLEDAIIHFPFKLLNFGQTRWDQAGGACMCDACL